MTGGPTARKAGAPVRPGFTLDLGRCVGCGACVLACGIENRLPGGVGWRRVLQVNRGRVNAGPTYHLSVSCHHCERPPCAGACPSGALRKRADGLVLLNTDRCIGCRYCEMACTFGAPAFDEVAGVMTKCHLCHHRIAEGDPPACVSACPTRALGYRFPCGAEEEEREPISGASLGQPATEAPGFGDPAGAGPGLWVANPGGAIRGVWFSDLKRRLGLLEEVSGDPK